MVIVLTVRMMTRQDPVVYKSSAVGRRVQPMSDDVKKHHLVQVADDDVSVRGILAAGGTDAGHIAVRAVVRQTSVAARVGAFMAEAVVMTARLLNVMLQLLPHLDLLLAAGGTCDLGGADARHVPLLWQHLVVEIVTQFLHIGVYRLHFLERLLQGKPQLVQVPQALPLLLVLDVAVAEVQVAVAADSGQVLAQGVQVLVRGVAAHGAGPAPVVRVLVPAVQLEVDLVGPRAVLLLGGLQDSPRRHGRWVISRLSADAVLR